MGNELLITPSTNVSRTISSVNLANQGPSAPTMPVHATTAYSIALPSGGSNKGGGKGNRQGSQKGNQDPRLVPPNPNDSCCTKVRDSPRRWDRRFDDGVTRSWCAKCVLRKTSTGQSNTNPGRWTDSRAKHYTDEHRGGNPGGNPSGRQTNRANLAQGNSGGGNGQGGQVPTEVQGSSTSQASTTQQSANAVSQGTVLSLAQALSDLSQ